jgi:2-C-methyl-D-erythritol 4-phosphate cytidylyltransferase
VAFEQGWEEVTDDALLIEKMGIPIKVIEGSESNIKITTPYDLEIARSFLKRQGKAEWLGEKLNH